MCNSFNLFTAVVKIILSFFSTYLQSYNLRGALGAEQSILALNKKHKGFERVLLFIQFSRSGWSGRAVCRPVKSCRSAGKLITVSALERLYVPRAPRFTQ